MKILLIRPAGPKFYETAGPDIGLGYLMRVLKDSGHKVELYDFFQKGTSTKDLIKRFNAYKPELIGFKTYSLALPEVDALIATLRRQGYNSHVVLGGPHPSGDPAGTLATLPDVSFVISGEAETGFPMLVEALEHDTDPPDSVLRDIPGLGWRSNGACVVNPAVFPKDFDQFGLPDWESMNPHKYPIDYTGAIYVPIMTTRGCPFHCTYCAGHKVTGRMLRHRSIDRIIEEIGLIKYRWGIRTFGLVDDNFTLDLEFAKEVCRAIISQGLDIRWRCPNGIRLDTLDAEVVRLMEKAGCFYVYVALESGSQRILDAMNRRTSLDVMIEKVKMIRRLSTIKMLGFFIIGYPDETIGDIIASIRLAKALPLDMASFFLFTPHPGTDIYNRLKNEGRLSNPSWSSFFYDKVTVLPQQISEKELLRLEKYAYRSFYGRPHIIKGILQDLRSLGQVRRLIQRSLATALNI